MMHKHLSIALLAMLLLTAVPALAQEEADTGAPIVSIEEMLLQQALNGERHIDGRMAQRILQLQEKAQMDKLAAAEAARLAAQSSSAGVVHAAAPDEQASSSVPTISADGVNVTDGTQTIKLDAATFRLLARLQNRTQYANPALHSGAPLAPSGPGTILAVFAMALAVGLTYLRAWMLEKRSKE
jgi:hypothetical protein